MTDNADKLFNITISEDSLRVYMEILGSSSKPSKNVFLKAIIEKLKQLKVNHGINQKAVEETVAHYLTNDIIPPAVLIAKGTPCVHKQNEGLKWFIDPDMPYDYQRVVSPDQMIAHTITAPEGIAGKDIYGLPIKSEELEDQKISVGNGAYYKNKQDPESGTEYIAYYSNFLGVMALINDNLMVRPIVRVSESKLTAQIELFGFLGDDELTKVNILHILDTLERMNIHYGWDGKLIQTALFNSHRVKPVSLQDKAPDCLTIVTGKPPVAGKFGELEWRMNIQSENILDKVALPGQTIASYQCYEEATPGVDVFGEIIPVDDAPESITPNGEGISLTVKDKELYRYVASYIGLIQIGEKVDLKPLLTVSEDKLHAYLELPIYSAENKKDISYAAVQKSFEAMNISYGIQEDDIKQQLADLNSGKIQTNHEHPFHQIIVAKGKPAKDGIDARLELNHSLAAGKLMEDGSIDFKERSYPWNVKKDDEIGRKIPLVPAVKGIDVFNNRIDAKPAKDLKLTIVGIHHTPDGVLHASLDGVLIVNQNNLAVTETLVLSGDVSAKTGNIHTDSTVMVKGVVDPGFTVETKADIIIEVNIEKAIARAQGNVIVHGGVRGNRSIIEANGEVNANFMEHADVVSKTNIVISENALDCNFTANDTIDAGNDENRNCSVIGGHLHAFNKISVGELGSSSDIKTYLSVGYTQADLDRQAELADELEAGKKRFDHIENIYASSQAVGMSEEVMMMMAELEPLGKKLEALKEEHQELSGKIESAKESVIEVHKVAYPGVSITICDHNLILNREYKRGKFCLENGQIVFNNL